MNNVSDFMLRVLDRASSKLGPISSLLDKLVERVVPAGTASACGGYLCRTYCGLKCGPDRWERFRWFAPSPSECSHACVVQDCGC